MNWDKAIEVIEPHVVKIETPSGSGTGFLAFYNFDRTWCGIATAAHVVGYADSWQQPIRIRYGDSVVRFLKEEERIIFAEYRNDSAIVLFLKGNLQLPETPIALLPTDQPCRIGSEIGWLGYPSIAPESLCFFSGTVSARQAASKAYLVDGVAINGVSGGPVFHCVTSDAGQVQIIGCVSAYHVNRVTGEALPGLLRAQDVSHFHDVAAYVRNYDEARLKKREFDEKQAAVAAATNVQTPTGPASGDTGETAPGISNSVPIPPVTQTIRRNPATPPKRPRGDRSGSAAD
jgi:hypothetical protein